MLISCLFQGLLLFSFAARAADEPKHNLEEIWEIDDSCNPHKDKIKSAYKDAVKMVQSAVRDLQLLRKDPPASKKTRAFADYARAKRLMYFIFGIRTGDAAHDAQLRFVQGVFNTMNLPFTEGRPHLPNGYSGEVEKPLLLCGDEMWQWVGLNDPDPTDPEERPLSESRERELGQNGDRIAGGWSYKNRMILTKTQSDTVGICPENRGGLTSLGHDWITLCGMAFEGEFATSASAVARGPSISVADGVGLRDFHPTLSRLMIHEFAHYYSDMSADGNPNVIDQQAVNSEGELLWDHGGRALPGRTDTRAIAYGIKHVVHTSREHEGNENCGPDVSQFNAETYAYYAIASYLNRWEWPLNARPEALPENPGDLDEPWDRQPPKV